MPGNASLIQWTKPNIFRSLTTNYLFQTVLNGPTFSFCTGLWPLTRLCLPFLPILDLTSCLIIMECSKNFIFFRGVRLDPPPWSCKITFLRTLSPPSSCKNTFCFVNIGAWCFLTHVELFPYLCYGRYLILWCEVLLNISSIINKTMVVYFVLLKFWCQNLYTLQRLSIL